MLFLFGIVNQPAQRANSREGFLPWCGVVFRALLVSFENNGLLQVQTCVHAALLSVDQSFKYITDRTLDNSYYHGLVRMYTEPLTIS